MVTGQVFGTENGKFAPPWGRFSNLPGIARVAGSAAFSDPRRGGDRKSHARWATFGRDCGSGHRGSRRCPKRGATHWQV